MGKGINEDEEMKRRGGKMRINWEPKIIENARNEKFDQEQFDLLVEELSGIIYSDMCQLSKIQFNDSFNVENNFLQRTGTDG